MKHRLSCFSHALILGSLVAIQAPAAFITFEGNGATPASITAARDAFRLQGGGGNTAAANGDFGGLRREINWDGVPDLRADSSTLPADFFNTTSPRGAVFSTPGTGFSVSANAGLATPILFGFPVELQAFSAQRLFAILGSNVMDINFFLPGTNTVATTSGFAAIFVDVESANETKIEFFGAGNTLLYSRFVLTGVDQRLSFVGATANAGEAISRVRITMPNNFLTSNGSRLNEIQDFVVMDDFLYATPTANQVPEPSMLVLASTSILALAALRSRRR